MTKLNKLIKLKLLNLLNLIKLDYVPQVTIMLADGVFVDTLSRSAVDYDFSTRRIYPLFKDIGLDFTHSSTFVANLRAIAKASVDYTVKGDDSGFRALLAANGKTEVPL